MSSYINTFLKTELTIIPSLLDKCMGSYYNNTLCNGATWMFLFWYLLHISFDAFVNALLKKMKFQEYIRVRLKRSLWYLGFYGSALIYCIVALRENNMYFFKLQFENKNSSPSVHLILGFIVLSTFYLHSFFWEGLKYENGFGAVAYLCIFLQFCVFYGLRLIEGSFRLTILISTSHILLEIIKCIATFCPITPTLTFNNMFLLALLATYNVCFITNWCFINSIVTLYPLMKSISIPNGLIIYLQFVWLCIEAYTSILYKLFLHYYYHFKWLEENNSCAMDFVNCSLFGERSDSSYVINKLLKEVKEREDQEIKMRKPKNRNVVMQTLKCMVTIKRKLKDIKDKQNKHDEEEPGNNACVEELNNSDDVVGGNLQFNIQTNNRKTKEE